MWSMVFSQSRQNHFVPLLNLPEVPCPSTVEGISPTVIFVVLES